MFARAPPASFVRIRVRVRVPPVARAQVKATMDGLLDCVAPRRDADVAVAYVIDHILHRTVRETYGYESERVVNAIVDELVDRASRGYFLGSGATWDVRCRNARSGEEYRTVVPAVVIKVGWVCVRPTPCVFARLDVV